MKYIIMSEEFNVNVYLYVSVDDATMSMFGKCFFSHSIFGWFHLVCMWMWLCSDAYLSFHSDYFREISSIIWFVVWLVDLAAFI